MRLGIAELVVGRFEVMAILQAARAEALGLPLESALSWGLNRAIFIAAAKQGFKGIRERGGPSGETSTGGESEKNIFRLEDDMALKSKNDGKLYFTIGGEVQIEESFEKQIKSRFSEKVFAKAWEETVDIVLSYDKKTLKSGREF